MRIRSFQTELECNRSVAAFCVPPPRVSGHARVSVQGRWWNISQLLGTDFAGPLVIVVS